jgi:hypothetical protein
VYVSHAVRTWTLRTDQIPEVVVVHIGDVITRLEQLRKAECMDSVVHGVDTQAGLSILMSE